MNSESSTENKSLLHLICYGNKEAEGQKVILMRYQTSTHRYIIICMYYKSNQTFTLLIKNVKNMQLSYITT